MDSNAFIALLVALGIISVVLSVRWKKAGFKPTGIDYAMGMSKAKAMALMVIGICSLLLAAILTVASFL